LVLVPVDLLLCRLWGGLVRPGHLGYLVGMGMGGFLLVFLVVVVMGVGIELGSEFVYGNGDIKEIYTVMVG